MTTPLRNGQRERVLLVYAGEGNDWAELKTQIEAGGRTVVPLYAKRDDQEAPHVDLPKRLQGFRLAVMVISKPVGRMDGVTVRRLAHLAGLLQGAIGADRVVAFTESEIAGVLHETPVREFLYPAGDIQPLFPEVTKLLEASEGASENAVLTPPPPKGSTRFSPMLERLGIEDSTVPPELWLALGALVVLTALAGVIGFWAFSGPDERAADGAGTGAETIAPGGSVSADGGSLGSEVASPTASSSGEVGQAPVDGAGLGVEDGRFGGLPAICRISTGPGEIITTEVTCEGIGGLRAAGFLGPWHEELSEISMDSGVIGSVQIKPRPDAQSVTRVQLDPAVRQSLEPYDSLFGVQQLRFEFSANNQQVVLYQRPSAGGETLTLTFSLDL